MKRFRRFRHEQNENGKEWILYKFTESFLSKKDIFGIELNVENNIRGPGEFIVLRDTFSYPIVLLFLYSVQLVFYATSSLFIIDTWSMTSTHQPTG